MIEKDSHLIDDFQQENTSNNDLILDSSQTIIIAQPDQEKIHEGFGAFTRVMRYELPPSQRPSFTRPGDPKRYR